MSVDSVEVGGPPPGHGVHRSAAHPLHLSSTRAPATVRSRAHASLVHRPLCQGARTMLLLLLLQLLSCWALLCARAALPLATARSRELSSAP